MSKKPRKIDNYSVTYTEDVELNFEALIGDIRLMQKKAWETYRMAKRNNNVNIMVCALKQAKILLDKEVKLLIKFKKIIPPK